MNTDELRHLLEMAAKACGAQIEPCVCSSQPFRFKSEQMQKATEVEWVYDIEDYHWSPHADDGMSARMRTALRMNVIWSDTAVHCLNSMGGAIESFADHNGDRNASLRLCALKVAAMIGEGME